MDCSYDYAFHRGYPPVVNHAAETEFLIDCASKVPEVKKIEETEPQMGGEDFAYYLQHVKGTFFFTGAKPQTDEAYPHHHPMFDFDEKAMVIAAKTLCSAALHYQSYEKARQEKHETLA